MFFNRTEFDRYARFHSWGTTRETFTWYDLIDVEIPIPPISVQHSIANIYKAYKLRKQLLLQLKNKSKTFVPFILKGRWRKVKKHDLCKTV